MYFIPQIDTPTDVPGAQQLYQTAIPVSFYSHIQSCQAQVFEFQKHFQLWFQFQAIRSKLLLPFPSHADCPQTRPLHLMFGKGKMLDNTSTSEFDEIARELVQHSWETVLESKRILKFSAWLPSCVLSFQTAPCLALQTGHDLHSDCNTFKIKNG